MDHNRTPLFDVLSNHVQLKPISLHVPGHKSGDVYLDKGLSIFKGILSIDLTELKGLDDLHHPEEAILEAELLLSDYYGSEKSFFLVNGSTVGNLAMILSVCSAGDTVIVSRNCHKSVMNGLRMAGAKPVFMMPKVDEELKVASYVSEETIIQAIHHYPDAKAIILTNPNYYGQTYDLINIIQFAHGKGIPVLVDEAHGAHFGVGDPFPVSAVNSGADIVVQSAHKTLPAMTMGSYLHFQSSLVSLEKIKMYLSTLQSSSPSYPIMASLDLARSYIATFKTERVVELVNLIKEWKEELKDIPQIKVVNSKDSNVIQDPLKVTLQSCTTLSGYELQTLFEEEGIYTELADPYNVLCVLPLEAENLHIISKKMKNALSGYTVKESHGDTLKYNPLKSEFPYSYWELRSKGTKLVTIEEAIHQLSAETIIPYPPGIPLLLHGERISVEHIDQLRNMQIMGAKFQGLPVIDKINIIVSE